MQIGDLTIEPIVDGVMKQPQDTYWQLGRWVLGHPEDVVSKDVANHARGWR